MPSKSKAQQRFFGMVDAYKKGEMKNPSSKIKKAADGMSMSDVKDFAETKHKGLPEKVSEQTIIRLTESDLHRIVKESVEKILNEAIDTDWRENEFVTWDEYQYFCNHGYDWVEKNEKRCDKLGVPKENRCDSCQRELKGKYHILYVKGGPSGSEFYVHQVPNSEPVKIGNSCIKAFKEAHLRKYGH